MPQKILAITSLSILESSSLESAFGGPGSERRRPLVLTRRSPQLSAHLAPASFIPIPSGAAAEVDPSGKRDRTSPTTPAPQTSKVSKPSSPFDDSCSFYDVSFSEGENDRVKAKFVAELIHMDPECSLSGGGGAPSLMSLRFDHHLVYDMYNEDVVNPTVVFLGKSPKDSRLIFRNPRFEEIQRSNIPKYTQALRNAVASSLIPYSNDLLVFVPDSITGVLNGIDGVFQSKISFTGGNFLSTLRAREKPRVEDDPVLYRLYQEDLAKAKDMALLTMLLRDTDSHEENFGVDDRGKVAFFDLGCSLADAPLPLNDREGIFLIHRDYGSHMDVPFLEKHVRFLESIDFDKGSEYWSRYEYPEWEEETVSEELKDFKPIEGHCGPSDDGPDVPCEPRLVNPGDMVEVMKLHARFLLRCAKNGKTMLFAMNILYGPIPKFEDPPEDYPPCAYDDIWIGLGGTMDKLPLLEQELLALADR